MNRIISSIYCPDIRGKKNYDLSHYLPENRTIYFAYGRQALEAALIGLGIKEKEEILVPEFICTDVLAPFKKHNFKAIYYKVSEALIPDYKQISELISDSCKTLLVVNYFGFPQPWEYIMDIQKKRRIIVIEDNAHGFLSSDRETPLGLRGDLGIFSLRKTLSLPNGGALAINNKELRLVFIKRDLNTAEEKKSIDWPDVRYLCKEIFRPLIAKMPPMFRNYLLKFYRGIQKGTEDNLMESPAWFSLFAKKRLMNQDLQKEVARRRGLFKFFEARFRMNNDCKPIFNNLPEKICPYGYPFYYNGNKINSFFDSLLAEGIPALLWPELPDEIKNKSADYYSKLVLIPFLW